MRNVYDPNNTKRFAPWVLELRGKSGAYRIAINGRVVYVGSSVSDLYNTLTRHFQRWERRNRSGSPGEVFDRYDVKVAVVVTSAEDARVLEDEWIAYYKPTINERAPANVRHEVRASSEEEDGDIIDELADAFGDFVPF